MIDGKLSDITLSKLSLSLLFRYNSLIDISSDLLEKEKSLRRLFKFFIGTDPEGSISLKVIVSGALAFVSFKDKYNDLLNEPLVKRRSIKIMGSFILMAFVICPAIQ